jgi:excisionase family DNA binding protein
MPGQFVAAATDPGAPLLNIPAVARRLDVCEKTVHRFIARSELRAYRVGRQLRVSEEELLRFLNASRSRSHRNFLGNS